VRRHRIGGLPGRALRMAEFLVIAPHVDDEALGCGGVLDERFHVHFCGVEPFRIVDREHRLGEARACAGRLGFSFSIDLENVVNQYQVHALIGQVERLVNEHRPSTVFLPAASYNQDHRAVLDAGLVALRPHDQNHQVANVLLFEQVDSMVWAHREDLTSGHAAQPNCFFPIDVRRKLEAYLCHASQVRGMRPPGIVEALARWRGFQAGFEFAEAFFAVRIAAPTRLSLGLQRATSGEARA
jgi:N-acetylglucosamine malate deacetylase 1